jgi:hypothetical protein
LHEEEEEEEEEMLEARIELFFVTLEKSQNLYVNDLIKSMGPL